MQGGTDDARSVPLLLLLIPHHLLCLLQSSHIFRGGGYHRVIAAGFCVNSMIKWFVALGGGGEVSIRKLTTSITPMPTTIQPDWSRDVIWWATTIYALYSPASFIGLFFTLTADQTLIASIWMLPRGFWFCCIILYEQCANFPTSFRTSQTIRSLPLSQSWQPGNNGNPACLIQLLTRKYFVYREIYIGKKAQEIEKHAKGFEPWQERKSLYNA
jgi:hypothetical protein